MHSFEKLFITGGAGFIGSALIRYLINHTTSLLINLDKLTYAGNLDSLAEINSSPRHIFEQIDICDMQEMNRLFEKYQPDALIHLAAESHVDRSIFGPSDFVQTNVLGTCNLLEAARLYWEQLPVKSKESFRFLHISTDEVYGDLSPNDPAFTEKNPYNPSSPYSASKASADHMVRAWHRTYGLPAIITNCSNNYGPFQFPEKLIPLMILNALEGKPLPVYGQGENIRDWLYIEDHVRALLIALEQGMPGWTYNIGGSCEKTNIEVVRAVCDVLEQFRPAKDNLHDGVSYQDLVTFVQDRPGHDLRYAIDSTRIRSELGWQPLESFESGLRKTVKWYLDHPQWVNRVRSGEYMEWIRTNYALQGRGEL